MMLQGGWQWLLNWTCTVVFRRDRSNGIAGDDQARLRVDRNSANIVHSNKICLRDHDSWSTVDGGTQISLKLQFADVKDITGNDQVTIRKTFKIYVYEIA